LRAASKQRLSGLYLLADLSIPEQKLLHAVSKAIRGGVQIVQIWNAADKDLVDTARVARNIRVETSEADIPLIVNNDLDLAKELGASGVHFDDFQVSADDARRLLGTDAIVGYTCGNDHTQVRKADGLGADYLSFCAAFSSPSVQSCEIVLLESIRLAKRTISIPVFASGGITRQNAHLVLEAGADGLAIASAILRAEDSEDETRAFKRILDKFL
jgi:thiamine-phosphate pyrophosphorylase